MAMQAAAVGDRMGGPSGNEITGTMLDAVKEKPIRIPKDVPASQRKTIRDLYKTNPHWDVNQLHLVTRLVEYRELRERLNIELNVEGLLLESLHGDMKMNPAFGALSRTDSMILSIEKALALTINERNAAVPKQDREHTIRHGSGRGGKPKVETAGKPNLRLA